MKKIKVCILLTLIMSFLVVDPVWATTISDLKKQKEEAQKELDAVNSQINSLQGQQNTVLSQISQIDDSLVEILASISMIEDELNELTEEIARVQAEYDAAKAEEEEQYEAMKHRIKFMYEKGDASYLQLFLEAKSLSDLVNKADYIEKLYEYDRNLLLEYQEVKQQVQLLKDSLEEEQADLATAQHEYEEEKSALDIQLADKKAQSKDFEVLLAKAKQDAAAYKTKIKSQTDKIKQLEAEEARKQAAANGNVGKVDPSIITNATGSALGKEIATYAIRFVGNPYVAGGTSLTNGADCSGFTYAVYKDYGYKLPRTSTEQRSAGRGVEYSQAEPGDLICYAGHVGIYIGGGKIVHASSAKTGIKISYATYKPILAVRRIV